MIRQWLKRDSTDTGLHGSFNSQAVAENPLVDLRFIRFASLRNRSGNRQVLEAMCNNRSVIAHGIDANDLRYTNSSQSTRISKIMREEI